jgi:serine/threonine-protein kinase
MPRKPLIGRRYEWLRPVADRGDSLGLARDRQTGLEVVIKRGDDVAHEAAVLRQLDHPGIVRLLDAGEDYIVLEALSGPHLEQAIADAPLTERRAMAMTGAIATALAHVHARGFVHRDVKPENIFLEPAGRVVLIDFDVAVAIDTANESAETAVGTPLFMSPEQLRPRAKLSGAVDVYALGVVSYYAMSQCLPYPVADAASLARAIHTEKPRRLNDLVDVSYAHEALIGSMLAKKPGARPSAAEVAAALLPVL